MNAYEALKTKFVKSKNVKLRKYSSMPDLQKQSIEQMVSKMRAVSSSENISELIPIVKYKAELESYRKKTMQERLDEAAPYNLFFNVLEIAPETYKQPNAIKFTDLLCPSLGKLKCSLHICYHVDIHWLMEQYELMGLSDKPMVIVTTSISDETITNRYPNVMFRKIMKVPQVPGTHNSKISIFIYEDDSLRVTCGSVNPYYSDWNGSNQAIWVSPRCPPLSNNLDGESITNFKSTLLEYLMQYKFNILKTFIETIEKADFQHIRVFLITCFPSSCTAEEPKSYIRLISSTLNNVSILPNNYSDWKIVMCSPCIGLLEKGQKDSYFRNFIMRPLAAHTQASSNRVVKYIYRVMFPCIQDILDNGIIFNRDVSVPKKFRHQKWMGGQDHDKMLRMQLLGYGRSTATLRASIYYRISPCSTKLSYFLLTSANMTRSSWGLVLSGPNQLDSKNFQIEVKSYEAGILFIPHFFNENYFTIKNEEKEDHCKLFPMLTDPLDIAYSDGDELWYTHG